MIVTYKGGPLDKQWFDAPEQRWSNLGNRKRYGPTAWIRKTEDGGIIAEETTPDNVAPSDWVAYRVAVYVRDGLTFHYLRDEEVDRCAMVGKGGNRCETVSKEGSAYCDWHDRKYCAAILPSGRCKVRVELGSDYCKTHKKNMRK